MGVSVDVSVGAFRLRVPPTFAMSGAQFAKNYMLKSMLTLFILYQNEVTKRTKKIQARTLLDVALLLARRWLARHVYLYLPMRCGGKSLHRHNKI